MMRNRRDFLRDLGLSAAALPFVAGLPSLQAADTVARRQRLIIIFSPNGTLPPHFWQDKPGPLGDLKAILEPPPISGRINRARSKSSRPSSSPSPGSRTACSC